MSDVRLQRKIRSFCSEFDRTKNTFSNGFEYQRLIDHDEDADVGFVVR